jgi:glucosamine--fructose-6-phosphate aminotransferase (isomerizing)
VSGKVHRSASTTEFRPFAEEKKVEYFFASDASAIIEHTNRVIFLEDDDVAAVHDGSKSLIDHFLVANHTRSIH